MTTAFDTNRVPAPRAAPAAGSKGSALTRQSAAGGAGSSSRRCWSCWRWSRAGRWRGRSGSRFTDATCPTLTYHEFIGFENYLADYDGEWVGLWSIRLVAGRLEHGLVLRSSRCRSRRCSASIVALVLNAHFRAAARARRGADPLGDPDHRFGQDVGLDAARPVRRHQRDAAWRLGLIAGRSPGPPIPTRRCGPWSWSMSGRRRRSWRC